jgi:hypothetical protein
MWCRGLTLIASQNLNLALGYDECAGIPEDSHES